MAALADCPNVQLCIVVDGPGDGGEVINLDEATAGFPDTPIADECLGKLFVPRQSSLTKMRQFMALSFVFCLTILLSSCAWHSNTPSDRVVMAAKKAQAEKWADNKAREEIERELRYKNLKEKGEYKNFASIKNVLKKDEAKAKTYPSRSAHVSKSLFAKEILAVNERLQTISKRVEDLSARVQILPELKMEAKSAEVNVQNVGPEAKTRTQSAAKSGTLFWGVQIGAYKTRPGAETAWGEFLDGPTSS